MSTITKLDPKVRRDRKDRAVLLRDTLGEAGRWRDGAPRTPEALAHTGLADRLQSIKDNPRMSGAAKQRAFTKYAKYALQAARGIRAARNQGNKSRFVEMAEARRARESKGPFERVTGWIAKKLKGLL